MYELYCIHTIISIYTLTQLYISIVHTYMSIHLLYVHIYLYILLAPFLWRIQTNTLSLTEQNLTIYIYKMG